MPLDAIKGFFDPSVQFGLQFETVAEGARELRRAPAEEAPKPARPQRKPGRRTGAAGRDRPGQPGEVEPAKRSSRKAEPAKAEPAKTERSRRADAWRRRKKPEPDKPSGGAEVVRLDRFRKK